MPEQIPDSLLPKASAKQEAFITHYIDKNYKKKKAQKQAMLQSAWATYQSSRNTCSEIVDLVQSVSETKEDYEFVRDMRLKAADAIAKIKPGTFKKLSDATKQVVAVAEDLVKLKMQALDYMRSQAQGGRDMTQEAAIKIIVTEARANLLQINAEFAAKAEELRAQVRADAPNLNWDPAEVGQFAEVFKTSSATLLAIPKTGDDASENSAKTAAAKAVETAKTASDTLITSMTDYANSDSFTMFVADMRRRDAVVVALKEARETLVQLNRWGVPAATKIGTDANAVENELNLVFADRSGLSPSDADSAEKAQDALLGKAVALGLTAKSEISKAREDFDIGIEILRPQVEQLEQRWKDCKKAVGKTQSGPIKAQIAAMRLSLDGLGGCNADAIDAVKKMIQQSTDLILEAEDIEALNLRIVTLLDDAKKEAKALTGKANPIAGDFAKHIEEIDEFKASFKEKTLTDATSGAQELLAAVRADATRNQKLIDRRREIMERIAKREQQLVEFNALFRQMLEHAGQTPKDYRGSFQTDIETCKSWAATKTDPVFYDTIDAKLTSILTGLDKEAGSIRLLLSKSNQDLLIEAATAATKHRDANLNLNQRDGEALAALAKAQAALAAIQKRIDAGEDVPASDLKAASEALAAANKARGDIADERGAVQKEYDDATVLLDQQTQLVKELAGAEAADELALRKKEEFIAKSKEWLAEVKKEVGDKTTVLSDYNDEADPQIERVKTARKMLKDDKPGVTGASALSELEFVTKFLDGLRGRGKKTDRRNLGDIGDQWDGEVIKVNNAAAALITAIEEFEKFPQIEGKASADVEKMFGVILGRMQDHAFEQAAKTFNDSEDKQVRKSAREQALSEIRRYRALMFNDPLLQKCVMNPFSVPVGSSAAQRLDSIELNVLRGI